MCVPHSEAIVHELISSMAIRAGDRCPYEPTLGVAMPKHPKDRSPIRSTAYEEIMAEAGEFLLGTRVAHDANQTCR